MKTAFVNLMVGLGVCLLQGSCVAPAGPLATLPLASSQASYLNLRGIEEYNLGKWEPAREMFELAVQADPNLPEAHFNLALVLHKLELHDQATIQFRKAGELAPEDKEIVGSTIYRNHLGLSSPLERHFSGGYRY